MKRRSFLVGVGVSVVAAAWPEWLRRAFADASLIAPGGSSALAKAQGRAHRNGKPVFAIIVPADDNEKYSRGQIWGEYLNHADPAQLAPLALSEVVCATLRELPSNSGAVEGKTLAMIIEPDGSARALDVTLRDYPRDENGHDVVAHQHIVAVAGMVEHALAADGDMLERRAADARKALGADAELIDRALTENKLSPAQADRGAALVALRAEKRPARLAHVAQLAASVEAKLKKAPPPGAHWANSSGCALDTVEDMAETETIGIGCGMGRIPELSRRFLYFFTQTPGQRMAAEWHADDAKTKTPAKQTADAKKPRR